VSADAQQHKIEAVDVIDLLAQLNDRSLILADERSGELRYRLLETVRQYGRDLLPDDEVSASIFSRHLDYFASLAEDAEPKLKGPKQLETLAFLERELENFRVALERETSGEGNEKLMQLAADLVVFWWRMAHFLEGTEWCMRSLSTPYGQQRNVLRARVLNGAGLLHAFQADYMKSKEMFEESRAILEEVGDKQYLPEALCGIGFSCFFLDDYQTAEKLLTEAYEAAKKVDDLWYAAWSGYMRGIVWRVNGNFDAAIKSYEEAIAIFKKLGDRIAVSYPLYDIGLAQYYRGNLEPASRYLSESLDIRRSTGDLWGIAESLFGLGLVGIGQKNYKQARERLTESKALAKDIGDKTRIAICAHWLGQIALIENDVDAALSLFAESVDIYQALEDRWGLAHCFAAYASYAALGDKWDIAVQLWSASDKLRDDIGSSLPPVERAFREEHLQVARDKISVPLFDKAWNAGRQLDMQQALDMANALIA